MSDSDQSWADDIREGLSLTSEGLEVAAQARDLATGGGGAPPPLPPVEPLAPMVPVVSQYGIPDLFSIIKDEQGWGAMIAGRRMSLLKVAIAAGVLAALYRLLFASKRGRPRRRR